VLSPRAYFFLIRGRIELSPENLKAGRCMSILIISSRDSHISAYNDVFSHIQSIEVLMVPHGSEGLTLLNTHKPEIIFLDSDLADMTAGDWLAQAHKCDYFPYFIVNLSRSSGLTKIELMKAGACDLIEAQFLEADIRAAYEKAKRRINLITHIQYETEKAQHIGLKAALSGFKGFVQARFYSGKPITMEEVQQFFPHVDLEAGLTADKISGAVHEDNLSSLVNWTTPKLLCVEDEEAIRNVLERTFSDLDVVSAIDAEDAMEKMKHEQFDTAIVDIGLPKMQGDELVAELKTLCPTLDVLMLTAFDDAKLIVNSFRNGACDYIVKPFDIDDLRDRVAGHFEYKMVSYVLDLSIKEFKRIYKEDAL
jgi:DNA-binding response OmpR family regulator